MRSFVRSAEQYLILYTLYTTTFLENSSNNQIYIQVIMISLFLCLHSKYIYVCTIYFTSPSFNNKRRDTYWQTYFYVVRTFLKNFLRVLRTQKNTTLMLVRTKTCANGSITLRSWFLKPFFPLL